MTTPRDLPNRRTPGPTSPTASDPSCSAPPRTTERLYHDLSSLWLLLNTPADYEDEAAVLRMMISRWAPPPGTVPGGRATRRVLDLGGGAGGLAEALVNTGEEPIDVTVLDASEAMLRHCEGRFPTLHADMRQPPAAAHRHQFDAVLCTDATESLLGIRDVEAMLRAATAYARPGGLVAVAPTEFAEDYQPGQHVSDLVETPDGERRLLMVSWLEGGDRPDEATLPGRLRITLVERRRVADGGGELLVHHDVQRFALHRAEGPESWRWAIEASGLALIDEPLVDAFPTGELLLLRTPG